jgi:tryptophan synthase beta chain
MDTRFVLGQDAIPTAWYNALPDLPEPLQPPLHPGTTAKESGEERVILFNYSGHGFLDLQAYDDFNHNRLIDA